MAIVCNRSLFNKYGWMAFVCYFEDSRGTSMNNIETMRLALKALTKLNASPHLEDCEGAFDDEIAALRQAIEQAQQAELVAWGVDWGKAGDIPCVSIIKRLPDGGIEVLAVEYGPPPRQPLTDEKLEEMAEAHVTDCYFDTLKYARAIEAAHGIKENT